jgi:hypothetical protein
LSKYNHSINRISFALRRDLYGYGHKPANISQFIRSKDIKSSNTRLLFATFFHLTFPSSSNMFKFTTIRATFVLFVFVAAAVMATEGEGVGKYSIRKGHRVREQEEQRKLHAKKDSKGTCYVIMTGCVVCLPH